MRFVDYFREFSKKLNEEKLLKKECDGMACDGFSNSGEHIGQTNEILGKCDHNNDGFLGQGCFHNPVILNQWGFTRKPKKKKKKT